jgi:L-cysteate sulfo-lyase
MSSNTIDPALLDTGWLEAAPRIALGFLPTPLIPLDRLSRRLGGPRLWLKRDDCTGLATGGNKTRKLEYLLAEARTVGADQILTFGAVQSNHARQTAAACAAQGLPCHLILTRRVRWQHPDYETSANVLIDHLLGATVEIVPADQGTTAARSRMTEWRTAGLRPYVIPTGGSNPIGALGYARCAMELLLQSHAQGFLLTDVMHASSSAGTQAGLIAGFAGLLPAAGLRPRVHGINVYEQDPQRLADTVLAMAQALLAQQQLKAQVDASDIRVDHRYLGEDYGIPTPETLAAIRLLGETEGVLLDPV